MRTSNPVLSDQIFAREARSVSPASNTMTVNGAVVKTGLMLILLLVAAGFSGVETWPMFSDPDYPQPGWLIPGLIAASLGALAVAVVTTFVPKWSPFTAPLYAVLEGLLLGWISAFFEKKYGGIVVQAVTVTVGVLVVMLVAYIAGVIRATRKVRAGILIATGGICLTYLATFLLGLFGIRVPYIHDIGLIGILFSLFVSGVAAFNLILDFDFIEEGARRRAPKYMEWYAGFGLLVTLVWLYLEILNLIAKIRSIFGNSR
jgi:uncharacterized YccA/Bax inhibitor family protein